MLTKPTYHRLKCGLNDIFHTKFLATVPSGTWGVLIINIQVLLLEESKAQEPGKHSLLHPKHNTHEAQLRLLTDQTTTASHIKQYTSTARLEHE